MTQAHRVLLKWARLIHVYVTLFGFVLMLFFAVTGFMLNHETWFLPRQTTSGTIPTEWLGNPEDRDAIVERLRTEFGAAGEIESFEAGEHTLRIVFQSDAGVSEATIQRADGITEVATDRALERITIREGKLPMELLVPDDRAKDLPIVEHLRKEYGMRGELNLMKYEKETESYQAVFKAPGYEAEAAISAKDGQTKVTHRSRGINGILLDLHRGKESGGEWSLVIDGVSILFTIVSITGLILWSSLRGRAQHGLIVLVIGTAIGVVVYLYWVPR